MEDGFVGHLYLAVGLKVGDDSELGLAPQGAEVVSKLSGVELSPISESDSARNAKASDDVPPYKPSYFGLSYDNFDLYPLAKVVDRHKEILALSRCFRKRFEDVHTPSSERQGTDNWRYGGGGLLLNLFYCLA